VKFLTPVPLLLATGCATASTAVLARPWHTLRAEQRVTVEVGGERRKLRAALAVARPDRFRLRALGPAGITLFDVVYVAGRVRVLEAVRDPRASALGGVIASMAGDLAAAYQLAPAPPGRVVRREGTGLTVEEPERVVREAGGRIEVENRARHYHVTVESAAVELDAPLDPQLFAE
jgi:hypothetical protein